MHRHHHIRKGFGNNLLIAIVLNVLITMLQIIGGIISGSLALISDSLHNFSDVSALLMSYIANKLTFKKNTREKTFGYNRAEVIAAFVNACSLLLISGFLIFEGVRRLFFSSQPEISVMWVIILSSFSIVANGVSVLVLKKDSKKNMNMRSAYLHLFSDMLSSFAVLFGGVIIYFWKIFWIDSVFSILIAVYLVWISWQLLQKALRVLMQFTPKNIDLDQIDKYINGYPAVDNVHHIHAWQLDDDQIHFEAHIALKEDLAIAEVTNLLHSIEQGLKAEFGIMHVTLQPEFDRQCREEMISQHPQTTSHT